MSVPECGSAPVKLELGDDLLHDVVGIRIKIPHAVAVNEINPAFLSRVYQEMRGPRLLVW